SRLSFFVPGLGSPLASVSVVTDASGELAYRAASCLSADAWVSWHPATEPSESLTTAHGLPSGHPERLCTVCQGTVPSPLMPVFGRRIAAEAVAAEPDPQFATMKPRQGLP